MGAKSLSKALMGIDFTINSKEQENNSLVAIKTAIKTTVEKYAEYSFFWKKPIYLIDIQKELKNKYPNSTAELQNIKSKILPDMGVTYLVGKNGKMYPICIGECKSQGLNDAQMDAGMTRDTGNAHERAYKNVDVSKSLFISENYFPYVIFAQGSDFARKSVLDSLMSGNNMAPFNKINVLDDADKKMATVYCRPRSWTVEEMITIIVEIMETSITYLENKYGKDFFKKT